MNDNANNQTTDTGATDGANPQVKVEVTATRKKLSLPLGKAALYGLGAVVGAAALGAGALALVRGRGFAVLGNAADVATTAVGFLARR